MVTAALFLLVGVVLAGFGGEVFVRGTVGLAMTFRVPAAVVGVTVAAFATSSPELSVAVSAGLEGHPEVSVGDALGSNVVNLGLILGLALLFGPVRATWRELSRDLLVALSAPLVTAALVWDGTLSRLDAGLLLGLFIAWLGATVRAAKRQTSPAPEGAPPKPMTLITQLVVGLGLLIGAGLMVVKGAVGIGQALGLDAFVVGVTLVSVGTSVPELATTVIARLRGHEDVALGTVFGSNLFNGLFVAPVAALFRPATIAWSSVALSLAAGALMVVLCVPWRGGLGRGRAGVLLLKYAAFVGLVLWQRPA